MSRYTAPYNPQATVRMSARIYKIMISFEDSKKYLFHGIVALSLNSVTIILLLGPPEDQRLALLPSALATPFLTRLCWLFGQEVRRLAALVALSDQAQD